MVFCLFWCEIDIVLSHADETSSDPSTHCQPKMKTCYPSCWEPTRESRVPQFFSPPSPSFMPLLSSTPFLSSPSMNPLPCMSGRWEAVRRITQHPPPPPLAVCHQPSQCGSPCSNDNDYDTLKGSIDYWNKTLLPILPYLVYCFQSQRCLKMLLTWALVHIVRQSWAWLHRFVCVKVNRYICPKKFGFSTIHRETPRMHPLGCGILPSDGCINLDLWICSIPTAGPCIGHPKWIG